MLDGVVEVVGQIRRRIAAAREVHAILAGQCGERDPERAEFAGGKLEARKGRGLVAGHAMGLRLPGAVVNRR